MLETGGGAVSTAAHGLEYCTLVDLLACESSPRHPTQMTRRELMIAHDYLSLLASGMPTPNAISSINYNYLGQGLKTVV